ncbi:uncharacterized protein [Argopecten irradians]|uniref:uncharacterized protein n=1 Tax=Argopecten irradians TaxID=31199 RepID=UPI00371CBFC5
MQLSSIILTFLYVVGWSIVWPLVKDYIQYEVLNSTRPPNLTQVTIVMEHCNSVPVCSCNMTDLNSKYTKLTENFSCLVNDVTYLQSNATGFNEMLKNHTKQINDTGFSVKNLSSTVTDVKGQLYHQSEQTNNVQADMNQALLKHVGEDIWKYLSVCLALGELFLLIWACRFKMSFSDRQPTTAVQPVQTNSHVNGVEGRPRSILDGIPRKSTENSVCVLSFNKDPAHAKHLAVSMSFLDRKVKVTKCIINREEDILKVPSSKVVLVHVDFNARNIILENPEREIGELKRKTVMALWKMNADVILLYHYEERNAKPLGEQDLYSSDLVSVKSQNELKHLEEQQRFISLNGQLSKRQRQHLSGLVKMKINIP